VIDPDLVLLEDDPLSERERECMRWVSEGKTTDEVAMILGVSSNTVNSYVGHAMQKLSASNRAMAMATAIRNGLI
jgi:DNA-binding CsgD family transcriptional regulator